MDDGMTRRREAWRRLLNRQNLLLITLVLSQAVTIATAHGDHALWTAVPPWVLSLIAAILLVVRPSEWQFVKRHSVSEQPSDGLPRSLSVGAGRCRQSTRQTIGRPARLPPQPHHPTWQPFRRFLSVTDAVIITVTTLFAGLLRLTNLERLPSGIHGDEGEFAAAGLAISQGHGPPPFGVAFLGDPAAYPHLLALAIDALGPDMAAIRLPSALFGTLTIPVFYSLVRSLSNCRAATIAATTAPGYGQSR